MEPQKIIKAGKIAAEIKKWIRPKIKKDMLLLEIAELIEGKIEKLGGKPAFPVNLSIDEQAAHYTPSYDDDSKAHGLLKVDFGVHIDGWIADTAFSVDLENSELNKKLIESSEEALKNAEKYLSTEGNLGKIGKIIEDTIHSYKFNPIINLSGHSMEKYDLHSGITVPNINNGSKVKFGEGLYAIEPFATNGNGKIHEGVRGNIYVLSNNKNTRSQFGREILEFIKDEYGSLPFASKWVVKKFGVKSKLILRQLEIEGILYQHPILTEEKGKIVSQTENTFLIKKDGIINTTKEN